MKIFPVLFLLLFTTGCSEGESPVDKKTTAKLYVDLLIVQEMHSGSSDSLDIKENKLFEEYGIEKDKYLIRLENYAESYDEWDEFIKYANNYKDSLKTAAGD